LAAILEQKLLAISMREGAGIRPPLKWAGGKRWLVPHLQELLANHRNRRLVEPFCGGLAVTLGLQPDEAVLNDINPHAINFYNHLKDGLKTKIQMVNDEEFYYQKRERFNKLISTGKETSREAAVLFYYLNRTGFNGLCRFNQQGKFNVPFGRYSKISYTKDFTAYSSIFKDWDFTIGDFETVATKKGDLIYADPPYDVDFKQYSKEGFPWEDQIRLAKWLSAHDGPVVLSNQATERITALYEEYNFKIILLDAPRMISCTGDRTKAQEVLAIKGF
jgi:DNA adenine methylase